MIEHLQEIDCSLTTIALELFKINDQLNEIQTLIKENSLVVSATKNAGDQLKTHENNNRITVTGPDDK